jgi:PAS domain S-box-containing protein
MPSSKSAAGFLSPDSRTLLDAMPDGAVVVDAEGKIVTINTQAEALFGWPRSEVAGKPVEVLVPQTLREAHAGHRARFGASARARPMGVGMNLRAVRRDGTELDVEISLAPLAHSGRDYVVACVRDCSERMRAAAKHKRLEEELRQAQKMESFGRLAGGIAHDFNNLLSVVLGTSSLILEDLPEGSPLRADIRDIDEAARRAAALTQQLLAFSRRQILEPSVIAVDGLVRRTSSMLGRVIGEDIEIVTVFAPDTGRARVDPGQLEQVILNLAINARDAMPAGGTLTLETCNVELDESYASNRAEVVPGRYVMIAVSDTGTGMDPATAARVFEPFFTTKPPGKGSGLGLSTVHGIVKQSGGHVAVYSEPGRGTAFKVYLPRVDAPESALSTMPKAVDRFGRGETILVVEDEDLVRATIRRVLVRAGYVVLDTADPFEALAIAESRPGQIHLLLTDVVMPKMGGHQLAERVGQLRPKTKIFYMSGYTDNTIVHHGVLVPGTAFIQKPAASESLARRVREVLDAPPGTFTR